MVDLGKYATEVILAYAVSLGLLGGLIWLSFAQSRRVKRTLDQIEKRQNG